MNDAETFWVIFGVRVGKVRSNKVEAAPSENEKLKLFASIAPPRNLDFKLR